MPNDFLHGVETVAIAAKSSIVTQKTGVIGLIGTAAVPYSVVKLVTNEAEDLAAFPADAGTIYESLKTIRKQYANAWVLVVSLAYVSGTPPTAEEITGTIDAQTGAKTGLKLFDTCRSIFGFNPKIFIAPRYSSVAGVATSLKAVADKFRGVDYLDAAAAMTVATVKLSRGVSGAWNFSHNRTKLIYEYFIDEVSNATLPASALFAANRAKVDNEEGFWVSSSNHNLIGIKTLETPITFELNDANCDANQINAQGITTIVNVPGIGFREWGNRNSAFPISNDERTFEAVQRTDDITNEAIELAMLPYIDKPMTKAEIDQVSFMANEYINTLITRGAYLPGSSVKFESSRNPVEEMKLGHYTWTKIFEVPLPGERFTIYSTIDSNLLKSLIA
jgi:phage tail sheath protein FI